MANYTQDGTYTLPNGTDFYATVDPGLQFVVFNLDSSVPSTFGIISNIGSNVTIHSMSAVPTVVNMNTNGGEITLGAGLAGAGTGLLTLNTTIDGGGTVVVPGNLVDAFGEGTVLFGSGGGTEMLGTAGAQYDLSSARIFSGYNLSDDVIDDQSLAFSQFNNYVIGGINVNGQQSITFNAGSASTLSLTVFGANLTPGFYSSTGTGPLLLTQDKSGGTDIAPNVVCYVRGTRIAAPQGESAVEALRVGDLVDASIGPHGERTAQPVKWLGYRRIDLTTHPRPEMVAPIRVSNGALAEKVPHRDLLLSPDHAVLVDGKLISARQLVNGTTIRQEKDWRSVDYFHVELEGHAILLAEGLPAESYLNTGNRAFFANADDPLVLHPDLTDETGYPTREASSCAPFVWDEASVQPVWQLLADRAAALGQAVPERATTTDIGLHILADGRVIKPTAARTWSSSFVLPKGATEVRVVSRASTPTDTRPWLEDRRRLGVYVERIVLRYAGDVQEVPLDHPGLSQGWWDVERNGLSMRRWTDGAAVLPLPAFDGPAILEIWFSSGGMIYLSNAEQDRIAA
jgi:hypothetical protein